MDAPPLIPSTPDQPPNDQPPNDPALRQWTIAIHLSPLTGMFVPFGNIIVPLAIWLLKKDQMPGLEPVGKTVLNFQLSWSIWMVVAVMVGVFGSCLVIPIGLPVIGAIAWLALTIIGSVKASNGETYKYPLTIEMIK